jgi:3-hydroxyacyl-CoA dehydrogenase/enoyl-CoA hydratase/3-hydroxybutyryl-CoA epimerase
VLTSVHDANIGSIFGIGFPAWTGGATQFIYGTGVGAFLKRADELAAKYGAQFSVDAKTRDSIEGFRPTY